MFFTRGVEWWCVMLRTNSFLTARFLGRAPCSPSSSGRGVLRLGPQVLLWIINRIQKFNKMVVSEPRLPPACEALTSEAMPGGSRVALEDF